jgi:hypothetical protein
VFQLRVKLTEERSKLKRPTMSALIAMTLKTWIAFRDRKVMTRLHVQRNEKFPDIDANWPPPSPEPTTATA